MSIQSFLSKLFGNKSQRDLKEIKPVIDKINAIGPTLKNLTNDELRGKIDEVRQAIAQAIKADEDAAAEIRSKVEDLPFDERQPLWDEIDKHEKTFSTSSRSSSTSICRWCSPPCVKPQPASRPTKPLR